MESLETELQRAMALSIGELADAIESIGFECTHCGACCRANEPDDEPAEPHTATLFPDEARELQDATDGADDWRDVARPMPYGLREGDAGLEGETFEWAIQSDACGDCVFYEHSDASTQSSEDDGTAGSDATGSCSVHDSRPLICQTYPFSVALGGTTEPMGEAVAREGQVRAHECEGLGRDIDREAAEELAAALKERAVRELREAIALRERYEPRPAADGVVVHDSEGAKRPDGSPLDSR